MNSAQYGDSSIKPYITTAVNNHYMYLYAVRTEVAQKFNLKLQCDIILYKENTHHR